MTTAWLMAPGLVGIALTLNAWRPVRWPSPVALASFFLGWLTTELALHQAALQAAFVVWAVHAGALSSIGGDAGVGAGVAACAGLVVLHRRGDHARVAFDLALRAGLGEGFSAGLHARVRPWLASALSWPRIALPFWLGRRDVETVRGVPFAHVGGVTLRLDVHRPRGARERCPTLVYVHGGGWVVGFRRFQGLPLMRHLAARGWVCFSVDYRLSPRATFPDHLIDVKRALAWVREHAGEHGADPEFVVLCGNSAGAHLAALAALTAGDARLQPGFEDVSTAVRGCVGLYGIYDFTDRHRHWPNGGLRMVSERLIMKTTRARSPELYAQASPVDQVHAGAPPFMLVHGDRDSLAPPAESRRFADALRAQGVPVVHAEVRDAQHAFEVFSSPRAAHFVDGATAFLAHLYAGYLDAQPAALPATTAPRTSMVVPRGKTPESAAAIDAA